MGPGGSEGGGKGEPALGPDPEKRGCEVAKPLWLE